jgi:diguanylate cyclase (GGDEF)-like protein/PAS domain S-box-containing protein
MFAVDLAIRTHRQQILLRAGLFSLLVIATTAWILLASYRQSGQLAEERLNGLAHLAARSIESSFRESDYVLRDVIGHIDPERIVFPDPQAAHAGQVRQMLQAKAQTLPYIYGIGVMTADCVIAYAARESPGFDVSQRPYCAAMRGDHEVYYSGIYLGQQNFLQMTRARKIRHADGRFAGAAVMRVDMRFFENWLREINIGPNGSAAVFDLDLKLAGRKPATPQALGLPLAVEFLSRFVAEKRQSAFFRMRSPYDEVERIYVVRRTEDFPMLVVLGLATEEVFAEWRQQAARFGLLGFLLLALGWLATRHTLKIREQAEALSWRSQAIDASIDGVVITDADGLIEYINPAFTIITGYTAEETLGQTPRVLKSGEQDEIFYRRLWATILSGVPWRGELVNLRKDGSSFHDLMSISPVKDASGKVIRFIAIHHDISERKALEQELAKQAHFDRLTGLPNRVLFLDRVDQALTEARREETGFALLFMDLDGFKAINDQYGHDVGDRVLEEVARRILTCLRESDTVSRFGGDEFSFLLRATHRLEAAALVAQKIIEVIGQPVIVAGHCCQLGASIGLVLHPDDGVDAATLLRSADFAMYEAKRQGKNRCIAASDLL